MSTADEIELAVWRLAFNHIGDGTPDGAAQAINAEMDKLKAQRDKWKEMSQISDRMSLRLAFDWSALAQIGKNT